MHTKSGFGKSNFFNVLIFLPIKVLGLITLFKYRF